MGSRSEGVGCAAEGPREPRDPGLTPGHWNMSGHACERTVGSVPGVRLEGTAEAGPSPMA